jgi:hypothetical protein
MPTDEKDIKDFVFGFIKNLRLSVFICGKNDL